MADCGEWIDQINSGHNIIDCNGSPFTLHILNLLLAHLQHSNCVVLINVNGSRSMLELGQMMMAQYEVYKERAKNSLDIPSPKV
jgi:hypothetical protein